MSREPTASAPATGPHSAELYRILVESVQEYAIFALDSEGFVLTWNVGVERLKGYTADEIIGKHFSVFYTEDDRAAGKPARILATAARTGQYEEEGWRVRKDGTRFWANVLITAMHDPDGRLIGFAKVTRDMTARREARERELESARRLAANEAARRAVEKQAAELRGANAELEARAEEERALRRLAQEISGATRVPEVMHQIAEGALAVSHAAGAYVEQVVGNDGVEIVAVSGKATPPGGRRVEYPGSLTEEIIARGEPVFLARMEGVGVAMAPYLAAQCPGCSVLVVPLMGGESVLGALVLLRRADEPPFEHGIVTRVRTLGDLASVALQRLLAVDESSRALAEAQAAVRSRDEVLSVVSHDLRNPLNTVTMSAALLQDPEFPLTDEQRSKQLGIIRRSAKHMNTLIQDLLDTARIEGGRLSLTRRPEEASALTTEACEAFRWIAADKSITLDCVCDGHLPKVLVDRDRIVQALGNFLGNAMKFTPEGGRIRVSASAVDGGVRFAVTDSGPGIKPEELPHVFERFWQAKSTAHLGSGLGLGIVKGIAEAHGGRVFVESDYGHGATFAIWLPEGSGDAGQETGRPSTESSRS